MAVGTTCASVPRIAGDEALPTRATGQVGQWGDTSVCEVEKQAREEARPRIAAAACRLVVHALSQALGASLGGYGGDTPMSAD